jgi:hypothetical protein
LDGPIILTPENRIFTIQATYTLYDVLRGMYFFDRMLCAGSDTAGVSVGRDTYDANHAPFSPGDAARIWTVAGGDILGLDVQPYTNPPGKYQRIWHKNMGYYPNSTQTPMSQGDVQLDLAISGLGNIPLDWFMVGIMYDKNDQPLERFNLRNQTSFSRPGETNLLYKHHAFRSLITDPTVFFDRDGNGVIDLDDLKQFIQDWLQLTRNSDTGDNITDFRDFTEFAKQWMKSYMPG